MTGLFVLVDQPFLEQPLQNSLNNFLVAVADCLRPFVILDIEFLPEIDELLCDVFDEFGRWNTGFRSRLLDLLAVLINAGEKKYIFTLEPVITCDHIGKNFLVSMANVRWRIR